MCFLPVKDWGLEKPAPQMRMEGGSPTGPPALTQAGRDQSTQTTDQTGEKTKDRQPGGDSGSHRSRIKIKALFPPKGEHHLSAPEFPARAGVTGER